MTPDLFIEYLIEQVNNGSIYVWGGQGQKDPVVCEAWIRRREQDTGGTIVKKKYVTYADLAVKTWKARCKAGYKKVLRAFDCSGLGVYFFLLHQLIKYDRSANGLRALCEKVSAPRRGYWVFRIKDGRASHIGYLISDTEIVHAKGRAYGVVREAYDPKYWHEIGKPKIFTFEPEPDPPEPGQYVFTRQLKYGCVGQDVIELKKLLIAHGFDEGITVDTKSSVRFGSSTKKNVKKYQRSVKIKADGIAGPVTITSLGGAWNG